MNSPMLQPSLIFLCGFMGAGKSTVGELLAKELSYSFVDLDSLIETTYNQTISELFTKQGETAFRNIETTILETCIKYNTNTVVALGGGTPCFNNNIHLLKKSGCVVYLKNEVNVLFTRLKGQQMQRPLIQYKTSQELLVFIEELLNQREHYYSQAHITITNDEFNTLALLKQGLNQFKL